MARDSILVDYWWKLHQHDISVVQRSYITRIGRHVNPIYATMFSYEPQRLCIIHTELVKRFNKELDGI